MKEGDGGYPARHVTPQPPLDRRKAERTSWRFTQGDEIAPGRYALKPLGGGSVYEVYLAWDDRLFCLVVVKLLRPGLVDDRRSLRRIRREANMLQALAHPAVVRSFDAVLDGSRPHIVQEFVEGTPLSERLSDHRLTLEQLLPLFVRLGSALHYLAANEVLHLDVKPANIVVGAQARLIDFSLARSPERAARVKHSIGTDPYMAPEQCAPEERGPITLAADMWGLGASLYHALSGQPPFETPHEVDSNDHAERFPQLVEDHRPLPGGLPPELAGVLRGCLRADPLERPSAAEFCLTLEELIVR